MVENRPFLTFLSHLVVLLGVAIIAFPLWMTFVASTHDQATMLRAPVPLLARRAHAGELSHRAVRGLRQQAPRARRSTWRCSTA